MRLGASHTPDTIARWGCASEWIIVNLMHRVDVIRVLCGRFFGVGDIVSVGYAIAHPRLNPVGILPPGSRPSDVHFNDDIIIVDGGIIAVDTMALCVCCCDDMRSM